MPITKRGAGYQASFMVKGLRYRVQFDTEREAETWEAEAHLAILKGLEPPLASPEKSGASPLHTIGGLFDYVKEHRWAGQKSERSSVYNGRIVTEFFGRSRLIASLTQADLDLFTADLRAKRQTNGTINRKLAALSKLQTEAIKHGVLTKRLELDRRKEPKGRLRFLEPEEEQALVRTLRLWSKDTLADLTEFLVDTGLRVGEALELRWTDCKNGSVQVVGKADVSAGEKGAKSNETRHVPQTERVRAIMRRRAHYDPAKPFGGVSYPSYRHQFERAVAHLGLTKTGVLIHTLRHTYASRLVMAGVDLYRVQTLLGHHDAKTTQRYAHLSPKSMDGIAAALAQFAPRSLKEECSSVG